MKRVLAVAVAAAVVAAGSSAGAVTYSVYDQFNVSAGAVTATNFDFGWVNEGESIDTIRPFTTFETACYGDANLQCAREGGLPAIVKAPAGAYDAPGTPFFQAGELNLHPGAAGELPVVQFIAPIAGAYAFSGAFSQNDSETSRNLVDVFASIGGAAQFPSGTTSPHSFNFNATLAQNAVVSFAIGRHGDYSYDSTGFSLTVTGPAAVTGGVPEPSAWAMMIMGFGAIGALMRRRQLALVPA